MPSPCRPCEFGFVVRYAGLGRYNRNCRRCAWDGASPLNRPQLFGERNVIPRVIFRCVSALLLVAFAANASAQDRYAAALQELQPRVVRFSAGKLPLQQAIKELCEQTGNTLHDERKAPANPVVAVPTGKSFWPALDALCQEAGCRYTAFGSRGVTLQTGSPAKMQIAYAGIFRFAVKRVAVVRDLDAASHSCVVALEAAWEPRFEPFFLSLGHVDVRYAADGLHKVTGFGPSDVAGRGATELEVRFPAPPRSCPKIDVLEGLLQVTGPSRMLDFTFDKLAVLPRGESLKQTKDGVQVSVIKLSAGTERWSVTLQIDQPPPASDATFESYQSWLENNRVALVHPGKDPYTWTPDPNDQVQEHVTTKQAVLQYHFHRPKDRQLPPLTAGTWSLRYRTPATIVRLQVPFHFENLPLP